MTHATMDDGSAIGAPDRSSPNGRTSLDLLRERSSSSPAAVAFRYKERGIWHEVTWAAYAEVVGDVARGLRATGFPAGGRLAVVSNPRAHWLYADLAAQALGGSCLGLYLTTPVDELRRLLDDAEIDLLVCERPEDADRIGPIGVRTVVVDDRGQRAGGSEYWADLVTLGSDARGGEPVLPDAHPSHQAGVLLVTAATTGPHKVVRFSSTAVIAGLEAWLASAPSTAPRQKDRMVAELPLAHPIGRTTSIYLPLLTGTIVHLPESPQTLRATMVEVRPTLLYTAPQVLATRASAIVDTMQRGRGLKGVVGRRAMRIDRRAWWAPAVVLRPLRRRLGVGRVRFCHVAGGPVSDKALRVWRHLGVPVDVGYALTECAVPAVRGGAALEVLIGAHDEVLLRGSGLFDGYVAVGGGDVGSVDAEGWLHTGDVGEVRAGSVVFRSRLSDPTVEADGGGLPASVIEALLREADGVIDAAVLATEAPPMALVAIDAIRAGEWAAAQQISWTTYESLVTNPVIEARVQGECAAALRRAGVKGDVELQILRHPPDPEVGESTPTRVLRRLRAVDGPGAAQGVTEPIGLDA